MNRLSIERRAQVVACLVEGTSIRGTVRMTGAAKNTVTKLLVELGQAAADYQDRTLRNLGTRRVECDEIWAFCYAKARNVPDEHRDTFGYGDVWTWVAIDSDTRLVPSWLVGERHTRDAYVFMADLRTRLKHRVQLTTDGHAPYLTVVEPIFGADGVDFAMLHKVHDGHGEDRDPERWPEVKVICGEPDPDGISTSYVERQNLTMRMGMRRFTRLTNGFSKKVENLAHAVSLHFLHYNFARPHQSLSEGRRRVTPAMAAGVARAPWSVTQIAKLLD